jgi:hypothetical protein
MSLTEIYGEVIHTYTRAQAIEDGALIDCTKASKEAGFKLPLVLTSEAWEDCVSWQEHDLSASKFPINDEDGRLWAVLYMANHAIKNHNASGNDGLDVNYSIYRVPKAGSVIEPRLTNLTIKIGPGDTAEPVLTISRHSK